MPNRAASHPSPTRILSFPSSPRDQAMGSQHTPQSPDPGSRKVEEELDPGKEEITRSGFVVQGQGSTSVEVLCNGSGE